jgi:hypothetical protein
MNVLLLHDDRTIVESSTKLTLVPPALPPSPFTDKTVKVEGVIPDVMTESDRVACLWGCELDRVWFNEDRTKVPTYRRLTDKEYRGRDERRYFLQPSSEDT